MNLMDTRATSAMLYLDGVQVDYVETLEGSGFKFISDVYSYRPLPPRPTLA